MTKPSLVYRVVNAIAYPEPPETSHGDEHNLTDIEASESDRHADMAARKAEPLVEALGIDAGVMGQQLDQFAAAAAASQAPTAPVCSPMPLAAAMRGDAHVLDQAARGALRARAPAGCRAAGSRSRPRPRLPPPPARDWDRGRLARTRRSRRPAADPPVRSRGPPSASSASILTIVATSSRRARRIVTGLAMTALTSPPAGRAPSRPRRSSAARPG